MALGDPTPKQAELLDCLRWFNQQQPTAPPTLRELSDKMNLTSLGTTQVHLKGLQSKGWVDWKPRTPRTLVLTPAAKKYFLSR